MCEMKFGLATVDITPPIGVRLWGYNPRRPSESVGHRLRAEALACEGATGGWILICADMGGFSWPLTSRVRADIAQRTGLPAEAVMIAATHTHSGPCAADALWCEYSDTESAYFRALRVRLADVAERAWRSRYAGTLLYAQTAAPELGSNRRVQTADGKWVNAWSDPEGKNRGPFDAGVDLVGVRREDGTLDALLVNYGCHPVCFGPGNRAISGDYVSYLKDALEQHGDARTVLFTVSGHANIDPRKGVQNDLEVVCRMGQGLAGIVRRAIPSLAPASGNGTAAAHEPWQFNTTWKLEEYLTTSFVHAASGAPVVTAVSALAAGSLALLGLPGEVVNEYRAAFRKRSPFAQTLLVSLANDCIGYLATDEILAQGAYEAALCPLNPIEAEMTARADAVLQRIRAG